MKKMNKYKLKSTIIGFVSSLFKILMSIGFAFPFYWMIITSVKTYMESIQYPPTLWPKEFTLDAYITVFTGLNMWPYLKNTVIILVCVIVLQMVIMIPAAYAFARYEFKGNGLLFGIVTVAFMVPGQVTFISTYIMFADMDILNTLLPQILPAGANAFGIFLLRQNFKQVPDELIESARLDEANEIQIMTKIMLPMAKSTFATIALLSFIGQWNAYFWPLVMTVDEKVQPISMVIAKLRNLDYGGQLWPTIMAGNVVLLAPILVLFLLASKKIIAAMAYNGVK